MCTIVTTHFNQLCTQWLFVIETAALLLVQASAGRNAQHAEQRAHFEGEVARLHGDLCALQHSSAEEEQRLHLLADEGQAATVRAEER